MDELAEKMGMDPFDLRYKNIYRTGDTTPTGCQPDVYCLEAMFDKLRPLYDEAKKRCKELSTPIRNAVWVSHSASTAAALTDRTVRKLPWN